VNRISTAILIAAGLTTALACSQSQPQTADEAHPPNIVLVSLDTLRADHLGCYGYTRDTSPVLDALAERGVLFERAIAQASHTQGSHMSLFQSRYPTRIGDENAILAQVLQGAGYHTAGITGGGFVSADFGFARGFETYDDYPDGFVSSFPAAKKWLKDKARPPFFLFLHTYDIHSPYDPGRDFVEPYHPEEYAGPVLPEKTTDYVRQMMGLSPSDETFEKIEWNSGDQQWMEALYDGGIHKTDEVMGHFIEVLNNHPGWSWERDILVIFSDHGEEFWDHESLGHGQTLYQEGIHVPLIMLGPDATVAGRRVTEMVMLMDLAPTLLEMVGITQPPSFTGRSFTALMNAATDGAEHRVVASETVGRVTSMIQYPWKLVRYGKEKRIELFNLEFDPEEKNPIQDDHPQIVAQLAKALKTQIKEGREIQVFISADSIEDEALREQLRALGYVE